KLADCAPQLGDVIVLDCQAVVEADITSLDRWTDLSGGRKLHGDIVVDVQPGFAETIGGNFEDATVGGIDSSRKRRYPLDDKGFLLRVRTQRFAQEDNAGAIPVLSLATADPLHKHSTARIFAVLLPIEDCVDMDPIPVLPNLA